MGEVNKVKNGEVRVEMIEGEVTEGEMMEREMMDNGQGDDGGGGISGDVDDTMSIPSISFSPIFSIMIILRRRWCN